MRKGVTGHSYRRSAASSFIKHSPRCCVVLGSRVPISLSSSVVAFMEDTDIFRACYLEFFTLPFGMMSLVPVLLFFKNT